MIAARQARCLTTIMQDLGTRQDYMEERIMGMDSDAIQLLMLSIDESVHRQMKI